MCLGPRYILDTLSEWKIRINVTNLGSAAFVTQLRVEHDANLVFTFSDVQCVEPNPTQIVCELGNPFPANKTTSVVIRFNPSGLKPPHTSLGVITETVTQESGRPTPKTYTIRVDRVAPLITRSRSKPEQIDMSNVTDAVPIQYLDDIGPIVKHIYNIINNAGPSDAKDVHVKIDWPAETAAHRRLLYLTESPKIIDTEGKTIGDCETSEPANPLGLESLRKYGNNDEEFGNDDWIETGDIVATLKISKRSISDEPTALTQRSNNTLVFSAKVIIFNKLEFFETLRLNAHILTNFYSEPRISGKASHIMLHFQTGKGTPSVHSCPIATVRRHSTQDQSRIRNRVLVRDFGK